MPAVLLAGAGAIVAGLAGALLVIRRRWRVVSVKGESMSPTLHDSDRVLVRAGRLPARGEITVFRAPPPGFDVDWMVKRVVAVPGDPVPPDVLAAAGTDTVPAGHIAVRGDNPRSQDSRHFGLIPAQTILGTVVRGWDGTEIPARGTGDGQRV